MNKKLILASAGAGKTSHIVGEATKLINQGKRILVITYTRNNQKEILDRFSELNLKNDENFHVKGLFKFLLEDIIRPYQTCIFKKRIEAIEFNQYNPHQSKGSGKVRWIPGRQEKINCLYNPLHFLTKCKTKAHTMFISKLATKIIVESKEKPIVRLKNIYDHIFIDEIQDFVGWDYEVIMYISNLLNVTCVGDFRQTIYQTSIATNKQPITISKKLLKFHEMKFEQEIMSINRRSVQCICDFADKIHANEGFEKTLSYVTDEDIPEQFTEHIGVFVIKKSDANKYIERYKPTLLRQSVKSGKQFSNSPIEKINFGESKGSGFDRVVILPTVPYEKYIMGDTTVFNNNKTDESKNKLYVAITRARYSLAFIIPDKFVDECSLPIWKP